MCMYVHDVHILISIASDTNCTPVMRAQAPRLRVGQRSCIYSRSLERVRTCTGVYVRFFQALSLGRTSRQDAFVLSQKWMKTRKTTVHHLLTKKLPRAVSPSHHPPKILPHNLPWGRLPMSPLAIVALRRLVAGGPLPP